MLPASKEPPHPREWLAAFIDKASRQGAARTRLTATARNARALFEGLLPLHDLTPRWLDYLIVAAVLCEAGRKSDAGDGAWAAALARKAKPPLRSAREVALVSRLCRFSHADPETEGDSWVSHDSLERWKSPEGFLPLLVMLRLLAEIEVPGEPVAVIRAIAVEGERVHLKLSHCSVAELRLLRAERVGELFEAAFGRRLKAGRI